MQIAENSAYDVPNGSLRTDGDDDYTKSGRRGSGVFHVTLHLSIRVRVRWGDGGAASRG